MQSHQQFNQHDPICKNITITKLEVWTNCHLYEDSSSIDLLKHLECLHNKLQRKENKPVHKKPKREKRNTLKISVHEEDK